MDSRFDPESDATPTPPPSVPAPPGAAPPTARGELRLRQNESWPTTIGVISIVLGSLGILANLWGIAGIFVARAFSTSSTQSGAGPASVTHFPWSTSMLVAHGVFAGVALCVSVWLLVAGIGLVRRKRWGVKATRGWAWARIATAVVQVGLTYWLQRVQFDAMQTQMASEGGPPPPAFFGALGTTFAAVISVLTFAWAIAWPLVCLLWLRRPVIRAQYQRWP
jgi:hypothetical protein